MRAAIDAMLREHAIDRVLTALHESGHVIAANAYGGGGISVAILPDTELAKKRLYGEVHTRDCDALSETEHVGLTLAGRLAEIEAVKLCPRLANDDRRLGDWEGGDLKIANERLAECRTRYGAESANRIKRDAITQTQSIVRDNFGRIVFVAAALLRAGRLNIAETEAVLKAAPPLRKYRAA